MPPVIFGLSLVFCLGATALAQGDARNLLDPIPGFASRIICLESFAESLRRDCDADEAGNITCEDIEVTRGSGSFTIVAPLKGVDLGQLSADSTVSCDFGGFSHAATLGEADSLSWARRTASFISGFDQEIVNGDGDSITRFIRTGSISYTWSPASLVISASFDQDSKFGQIATEALAKQSGPIATSVETAIGFAGFSGQRDVFITGNSQPKLVGETGESPGVELSNVSLSGSADYELPKLAFTGSAPDRIPADRGPTLLMTGSARDGFELTAVQTRLNGGEWTDAELSFRRIGTDPQGEPILSSKIATWSASIDATPGPNVVEARAQDRSGNFSAVALRRFQYVVPALLQVTVSPAAAGSVTRGYLGTTRREEGMPYVVTATPAAGFVFDGWETSEGGASIRPSLSFVMSQELSLTAKFVANPFGTPGLAATFAGLIQPALNETGDAQSPDSNALGSIQLTLTNSGSFSGSLTLGGMASAPFRGVFTGTEGRAGITAMRRGAPDVDVDLTLDFGFPETATVSGTIQGTSSMLQAWKVPFGRSSPYTGPARYTVRIPGATPTSQTAGISAPSGTGYATLSLGKSGVAAFSFVLPDETSFNLSAPLTGPGPSGYRIPICQPLYKSTSGYLHGYLDLAPMSASEALDDGSGNLWWSRPPNPRDPSYPQGFLLHPVVAAFTYRTSPADPVLPGLQPLQTMRGRLWGGQLLQPVPFSFSFAKASSTAATITAPAPLKLTAITFAAGTGTFSATYVPSGASRPLPIRGTVFQKASRAEGIFRGSPKNGYGGISLDFAPSRDSTLP